MFKLAVKNIISRKSSFVIIGFIAFSVALLVLSNSIFDSTERGVENLFISGFTGDFAVRPVSERPCSLFGDETPIIGELTNLNRLVPFGEIAEFLKESPDVDAFSPQFSGRAFLENPVTGVRIPAFLFAIQPETYFKVMDGIRFLAGKPFSGKGAVLLNSSMAEQVGASVGGEIQFVVADGSTFRIRVASVSGIYQYADNNEVLNRICLVDVETFVSLMELSTASSSEESFSSGNYENSGAESFDIDDLFFESEDVFVSVGQEENLSAGNNLENLLSGKSETSAEQVAFDNSSWNFITGSLREGINPASFINRLNKLFEENGWPVEAVNWRQAGGASSIYLYWLRVILNAGILVVLGAGFIVVNNTLVINVLSRSKEIGTMRAVGASAGFISRLFMIETFILTISAGILGSVLGWIAGLCLTSAEISFSNQMLAQLFGGEVLTAFVSYRNILDVFVLVVLLGVIAWIYPVRTALSTSPTVAMQGEKG